MTLLNQRWKLWLAIVMAVRMFVLYVALAAGPAAARATTSSITGHPAANDRNPGTEAKPLKKGSEPSKNRATER